ncbi:MAG: elongation factor P [Flavobacteriaceae bacterium]|nr:elongation factor P [Flavobacteriaceae bacterium]
MATTSDLTRGGFIRYKNELCQVLEYQHRTPGNLRAFYQVTMRVLRSGKQLETRFRAGEEIEPVRVEMKQLQYLYRDGENLVCMDQKSFDQLYIPEILFGTALKFLKEEVIVDVAFEGDNPIFATPPSKVELQVTYAEPGVQGNTATNTGKNATLETGAEIMVPLFVNVGEIVRVNTEDGTYMERVK